MQRRVVLSRFDPPSLPPQHALRAAIVALVAALALLWCTGCASMTGPERAFLVASAAGIGSTYYAVERGCSEANPLWGRPGMSSAEAVATSAAVTGILYLGLRWYATKLPPEHRSGWWGIFTGGRAAASGWNVYMAGQCSR